MGKSDGPSSKKMETETNEQTVLSAAVVIEVYILYRWGQSELREVIRTETCLYSIP